jgi:hypothetical protein
VLQQRGNSAEPWRTLGDDFVIGAGLLWEVELGQLRHLGYQTEVETAGSLQGVCLVEVRLSNLS